MIRSERFRRLTKEGFWIVGGQAMAVLGSLAGVRLLTELLDPASYGELALGMTAATLINQSVMGPLGAGVARFYAPAIESADIPGYLKAVRILMYWAVSINLALLVVVSCGLLLAGRSEWTPIAAAALVFALLSGCNGILSGVQNAARQRAIVAVHQGLDSWARFLIAAGLLLWLSATSTVAMIGYSVAVALVLGSQYRYFRRTVSMTVSHPDRATPADFERWRGQIWRYSWPISLWGVFTWAQLSSDRWALGLFATTDEVGLYAVLFQLGYYPVSTATGVAMQFFAPIFYERAGDATDSRRVADVTRLSWRLTALALGVTAVVFAVTYAFHAQLFRFLVAQQYESVSYLLPWVVLAGGLFAAGQFLALNLMSQMKTRKMSAVKIVTCVLGIAANFIGAYLYGTTGIVGAAIVFAAIYLIWMMALQTTESTLQPQRA